MALEKLGQPYGKNKPLPLFTTYTKFNLKWVIFLNVEYKIIKLLEENRGEYLFDLRLTPREKSIKIDKLDFIKIKKNCCSGDTVKTVGETICRSYNSQRAYTQNT